MRRIQGSVRRYERPVEETNQIIALLPESQPEVLIELPEAESPSDEALKLRCTSY